MITQCRILIIALGIVSLVAVAASAQAGKVQVRPGARPEVISGSDLGFQVEHWNSNTPVGVLVVKRDGRWVEVEFGARAKTAR